MNPITVANIDDHKIFMVSMANSYFKIISNHHKTWLLCKRKTNSSGFATRFQRIEKKSLSEVEYFWGFKKIIGWCIDYHSKILPKQGVLLRVDSKQSHLNHEPCGKVVLVVMSWLEDDWSVEDLERLLLKV
jgi:hypothetical protein